MKDDPTEDETSDDIGADEESGDGKFSSFCSKILKEGYEAKFYCLKKRA